MRAANESDYQAICDLMPTREELFLVYPKGQFPLTVEQLKELAQKRLELTVAEDGDKVIGFANLYDHVPGQYAFLGNVVIDKAYRGKGLGREIIAYMLNQAFSKYQLPEVRLSVFNGNAPAMLLYSNLGFKPFDIEERINPNGQRVGLIHMKLRRSNS